MTGRVGAVIARQHHVNANQAIGESFIVKGVGRWAILFWDAEASIQKLTPCAVLGNCCGSADREADEEDRHRRLG